MKISSIYAKAKGFTLIELLVVIAILATLAAVGYPLVMSQLEKSKLTQAKDSCVKLVSGVENFMADNNRMPLALSTGKGRHKNSDIFEYGDENYLLETAERKDAGMVRILVNQEDGTNINRTKQVYITATMAEEKGEPGIYQDPSTGELEMYDPWGNPLHVVINPGNSTMDPFTGLNVFGKHCLVFSLGPDNDGGPDLNALSRTRKGGRFTPPAQPAEGEDNPMADNIFSWKNSK